jgi:hypothetical protein
VIFFQRSATTACTRRVHQAVEQRVHAAQEIEAVFLQFGDEGRHVARIGDEHVTRAEGQESQAIRGQCKDVIERQRSYHDSRAARLHHREYPGGGLQHVGDHVAVGEHGRLGDAGGAAGVLQERDILRADRRRVELQAEARGQRSLE